MPASSTGYGFISCIFSYVLYFSHLGNICSDFAEWNICQNEREISALNSHEMARPRSTVACSLPRACEPSSRSRTEREQCEERTESCGKHDRYGLSWLSPHMKMNITYIPHPLCTSIGLFFSLKEDRLLIYGMSIVMCF